MTTSEGGGKVVLPWAEQRQDPSTAFKKDTKHKAGDVFVIRRRPTSFVPAELGSDGAGVGRAMPLDVLQIAMRTEAIAAPEHDADPST
jgi:hypothetical protein